MTTGGSKLERITNRHVHTLVKLNLHEILNSLCMIACRIAVLGCVNFGELKILLPVGWMTFVEGFC
jgi:hypothetical protein